MASYYGTTAGANQYFDQRLHSESWTESIPSDRPKALLEATRIIDALNYKGVKHSVWLVMYEYDASTEKEELIKPAPTRDEIITADQSQELEFPRGKDTTVPQEIEWACYETALAIIEGFDPEDAVERLNVIKQSYAAVRTTYAEGSQVMEYLGYGIPTARVWRWLLPYLTGPNPIVMCRVD
ncbi:hypothetical protein DRJ25_05115 [Candidatus Woesearchaeota archaeon]|nr:MAG: hypothetical protein DRJ25_05115 [Candidatus Woesearchaeota archaeon]